jgi:fructose-bisphosphate aldolase/6-deoxy-5-ketofructose 1-phosphate synthase
LWVYPRGAALTNVTDPLLSAGATGVATSLGADFVKIQTPNNAQDLAHAATAAGTTKVICSGGKPVSPHVFLQRLHEQLHKGGAHGCATGRTIFQRSLPNAIAMTRAISALVFDGVPALQAIQLYAKLSTEKNV